MMGIGWAIALVVVLVLGVWSASAGNFVGFLTTGVALGAVIAMVLVLLPIFGSFKPWYYILSSLVTTSLLLWGLFHPSTWHARINLVGVRVPVAGRLKSLVYIIAIAYFGAIGMLGILGLFDDRFIRYADNITSALIKSGIIYVSISSVVLGFFLFSVGAWAAYDLLTENYGALTIGDLAEMSIFMLLMGAVVVANLIYLF